MEKMRKNQNVKKKSVTTNWPASIHLPSHSVGLVAYWQVGDLSKQLVCATPTPAS